MVNTGRIRIELDKPRYLLLDLAAVARFEYNSGKPMFCLKTWRKLSKKETMLLLWAALAGEDPKLTPVDVLNIFKDESIDPEAVAEKLSTSWGLVINKLVGGKDHGNKNLQSRGN